MKRLSLLAILLGPVAAHAQRDAKIPDSDPEVERKSFIVAPGFEVNLFAADPLLAKPIQMNWDPQGRLWVATSETYPQILPGQKANDKIIILEDTKGVGVADKTTVFADGLLIPTGIEPGDGGAYVANSTELVHLSASKPGGKADMKRVLLSGFGTEDTHHIIHTFRWGPDGCLYFNQSIYIHSHIETPTGVKRLNAGGIWRYNTRTNDLSVFARGWVNSWGHAFDKYGQSFTTDGAGGEGINHVIPGGYYLTSSGPHASRILHGLNPGSPKHCGLEFVSGRHFPDDWQGNLITNDFRGHRVCRFVLSEDGSTYASREMPELIKTAHPAFRPIDVKMGPDGAIYIADWYNPIIQHGEVDFRDPRRDKTHGRIWRVTAKGRPLVPKRDFVNAKKDDLYKLLDDADGFARAKAMRVLQEKHPGPDLDQWVKARFDPKAMLGDDFNNLVGASMKLGGNVAPMGTPRERLYAIRTLAHSKNVRAAEAALMALDYPMDPTLDYALWLTLRELEPVWLPAFQKGEITFGGDPKKIAFAMKASGSPDAMKALVKLMNSDSLTKPQRKEIAKVLAKIGGPEEMTYVFWGEYDSEPPAYWEEVIQSLEESIRTRKVFPHSPVGWDTLQDHFTDPRATVRRAAYRLAGLVKRESMRDVLQLRASEPERDVNDRRAAFEGLISLGGVKTRQFIDKQAGTKGPSRTPAMEALVALDAVAAAITVTKAIQDGDGDVDLSIIASAFASRRGGGTTLANALKGQSIPADSAKLALARIRSMGANEPALVAALTAAGKLNAAKAYPTATEIKSLATEVVKSGDAARGEAIYRRNELQCLKCHAVAGVGGLVGPDMTSLGASAPVDYLVESMLNPNAKIKEGYNAIQVTTLSGKQVQGVKIREADGVLVLRNAEDKEESIRLDDIDARKESRSLMADGLVDSLTNAELADLVKFLSELGKVGPYAPNPARLFRKWEFVEGTGANTEKFRRARISVAAEKENGLNWTPVYTRVSGDVPLAEISKYAVWQNTEPQSVIRCHVDVTTAGKVRLKLNDATGLTVFVDGKPTDGKAEFDADVPVGQVPVTMIVDRGKRTTDVKLELLDAPGSPARAKPLSGK